MFPQIELFIPLTEAVSVCKPSLSFTVSSSLWTVNRLRVIQRFAPSQALLAASPSQLCEKDQLRHLLPSTAKYLYVSTGTQLYQLRRIMKNGTLD